MRRFSRQNKPKTPGQIKAIIEKLEFRLETEALKFSEEKKIRGQIKNFKKEIKNMHPGKSSFKPSQKRSQSNANSEPEYKVKDNFADILKEERLKKQMNHEEFAAFVSEKTSIYQKWENGSMQPPIDVAKRIQKQLKIGLVEQVKEADDETQRFLENITKSSKKKVATLGDVIKIKTRNR